MSASRQSASPAHPKSAQAKAIPTHLGHRARLRARLLEGGETALPDYELLEAVLFAALPRGDTKPLAKQLLAHFGNFAAVLKASPQELMQVPGVGEAVIGALKVVDAAAARLALTQAKEGEILDSWERLLAFCQIKLAGRTVEEFHLLYLDTKNRLIKHELRAVGTVDHTPVYVRDVIKRALDLSATALILVHNHPSGDPTPSSADLALTHDIQRAAQPLNIHIHDHLIFAQSGHYSLRSNGDML